MDLKIKAFSRFLFSNKKVFSSQLSEISDPGATPIYRHGRFAFLWRETPNVLPFFKISNILLNQVKWCRTNNPTVYSDLHFALIYSNDEHKTLFINVGALRRKGSKLIDIR